jgi:hypothetical protein
MALVVAFEASSCEPPVQQTRSRTGTLIEWQAKIAYLACVQLSHNPSTQVLEG